MRVHDDEAEQDLARLFAAWGSEDQASRGALFAVLYEQLRALAHRQVARMRPGETLRTTALVHEAYLRLMDGRQVTVKDRNHFLALAARVMRNILVDKAREQGASKRGGDLGRITLDDALIDPAAAPADVLAVDAALANLARLDIRQADVAQLRVFGGLALEEIAQVLELSLATIKRDWRKARMFLIRELNPGSGHELR